MDVRGWLRLGRAWAHEETQDQHDEERQRWSSDHLVRLEEERSGDGEAEAWAVLRLMTSSNFVGCSTGRSAGLAPFRILST